MNLLLSLLIFAAGALQTGDGVPVDPNAVRPAPGIRDPIFAYLAGLVDADLYGTIDAQTLRDYLDRTGAKSPLPYKSLTGLSRESENRWRSALVRTRFERPLALSIPYQILGYKPGSVRATADVLFREWRLGELVVTHKDGDRSEEVHLSNVHLFAIRSGTLWVDIDAWLDALVGGKIDDTRVTGLALFEYGGDRWGLAIGYNRDWQGRSGLLNMREDAIRFPSPPPIKTAAWKLRQILEGLEPELRPDSLRAHAKD